MEEEIEIKNDKKVDNRAEGNVGIQEIRLRKCVKQMKWPRMRKRLNKDEENGNEGTKKIREKKRIPSKERERR
jgi:hypothetical protein